MLYAIGAAFGREPYPGAIRRHFCLHAKSACTAARQKRARICLRARLQWTAQSTQPCTRSQSH